MYFFKSYISCLLYHDSFLFHVYTIWISAGGITQCSDFSFVKCHEIDAFMKSSLAHDFFSLTTLILPFFRFSIVFELNNFLFFSIISHEKRFLSSKTIFSQSFSFSISILN